MKKRKILVLDWDRETVKAIEEVLQNEKDYRVIGHARSAQGAMEACQLDTPNIVLMDLEFLDIRGLELLQKIRKQCGRQCKMVIYSYLIIHKEVMNEAKKLKVSGFIFKGEAVTRIPEILQLILQGETYYSPLIRPVPRKSRKATIPLSVLENQVMQMHFLEMSTEEIGERVGQSADAVGQIIEGMKEQLESKLMQ